MAWSRRSNTTKKKTTYELISPLLRQRFQYWGDDQDWERFWGGFKGYGGGDNEVVFNYFGDPDPPPHRDCLILTAAVTRIIVSDAAIAPPNLGGRLIQ